MGEKHYQQKGSSATEPDRRLTLRLFGRFTVSQGDIPVAGLHIREGERLLAFLTLARGEPVEYRTLAERFWPAEALQNAEAGAGDYMTVRQAIRALRVALREEAERLQSPVRSAVRLDLSGAEVDWERFERLAASLSPADWQEGVSWAERGPLLDGWTEPWAENARRQARRMHETLLRRLAANATQASDIVAAQRWLLRLLALLPEDAETLQALTALTRETRTAADPGDVSGAKAGEERAVWNTASNGGALPLESPLYVARPADAALHTAVRRGDSIILLKGPRHVGKTSLLARVLERVRKPDGDDAGAARRVVVTDFGALPEARLASPDAFFAALAGIIAEQLDLEVSPRRDWDEEFDASVNLERFLRRQALPPATSPLVWAIDEADRLFGVPFASEVFGLFRSWHNRRALDPSSPWSRLTLVIAYATEAHLLIADQNQSPFNIGTRTALSDLTPAEVSVLNRRWNNPLAQPEQESRLFRLLGGHPFLTQCALSELASGRMDMDRLEAQGARDIGPFSEHLHPLLHAVLADPEMADALRSVVSPRTESGDGAGGVMSFNAFYRLRAAGLIIGESTDDAQPRCRLYAEFFARHLRA